MESCEKLRSDSFISAFLEARPGRGGGRGGEEEEGTGYDGRLTKIITLAATFHLIASRVELRTCSDWPAGRPLFAPSRIPIPAGR